ncbi:MAG: SUF system NifU family Fe-S cluster assembly protein [Acidobacteriota bacterium]|nr:SUF system NifU family Fe-S cluster assembly protein [Acidobacteriota bacterium]
MMSELSELYQEVILDHNKRPRNFHVPDGANRHVEGFNPLCGDHFTIYLRVEGDLIRDAGFQGAGCAISKASASLMTDSIKGRTLAEADRLFAQFHGMVTAPGDEVPDLDALGKLAVFAGVREFPMRVKCASLAWHALHAAIQQTGESVTTE